MSERRTKIPKWSSKEKEAFLKLIYSRKSILFKRNCTKAQAEMKSNAWNEILNEMKEISGDSRGDINVNKLKIKWKNLKTAALREANNSSNPSPSIVNNIISSTEEQSFDNDELMQQPINLIKQEPEQSMVVEESEGLLDPRYLLEVISGIPENVENPIGETHENFNAGNSEAIVMENNGKDEIDQLRIGKLVKTNSLLQTLMETAEINKVTAIYRMKQAIKEAEYRENRMSGQLGDLGSGAGKGGGGGGSIREAGGSLGKMEAAREEEYFYKQQRKQLEQLKDGLNKEISFHEDQIKKHQEAIARHKERVESIDKN